MLRLPATLAFVVLTCACGGDDDAPKPIDAAVADASPPDAPVDADLCIFGCEPRDADAGTECPPCADSVLSCPIGCELS